MRLAALLLLSMAAFAIDGRVVNRSTNQPTAEIPIVLMRLGEGGMMPVGNAKSGPDGTFKFDQPLDGSFLMQAIFEGVTYNKLIKSGEPAANIELEIFNSARQSNDAKVVQHMMLVEPNEGKVSINESIIYRNGGNKTFVDPTNGTFKFYLPPEARESLQVRVSGPGNMPVKRDPEPAGAANLYKIDYPIKPGESRFDLNYVLPLGSPGMLKGRILHPINATEGQTRVVSPSGVKLSGDGLEDLGAEPQTQAQVYGLTKADYEISITGTGSLRALQADETAMPEPQAIPPKINERMYWILGLSLLALAIGFAALLRKPSLKA